MCYTVCLNEASVGLLDILFYSIRVSKGVCFQPPCLLQLCPTLDVLIHVCRASLEGKEMPCGVLSAPLSHALAAKGYRVIVIVMMYAITHITAGGF